MAGIVRIIVDAVWQDLIEKRGETANADAKRTGAGHRHQHTKGCFLHLVPAIMAEESEIGDFDTGMVQHTCRRCQQHEIGRYQTFIA